MSTLRSLLFLLFQLVVTPFYAVVMVSTSTCPYCALARAYLDQAKVEYRDFVIDQSADAQQQFQALGGGKVPLLFIGNRRIVGYREDTIRDSLALIRR